MKKTSRFLLLLSGLAIVLSGCTGLTGQAGVSLMPTGLSTKLTPADKTGLGILNLEDQALAVDAEQAKNMLPLWQALVILSADSNTSPDEIAALNEQIQETLSPDQLAAIAAMSWDEDELSKLVNEYSSSNNKQIGAENGAAAAASMPQNIGAGGMPGGAPPDGGGDMIAINPTTSNTAVSSHSTLPEQADREEAGGMNLILAPAVIELLKSKLALT